MFFAWVSLVVVDVLAVLIVLEILDVVFVLVLFDLLVLLVVLIIVVVSTVLVVLIVDILVNFDVDTQFYFLIFFLVVVSFAVLFPLLIRGFLRCIFVTVSENKILFIICDFKKI